MFLAIFKQELNLSFRQLSNLVNPLIFFFIAISIFAIAGQNTILIIWPCLIFAILLGVNNSFKEDFNDGTLEQLLLTGQIFELVIASKVFANWVIYSVPIILFIPITALILKLDNQLIFNLILITTIASFVINLIVNFGASLILSNKSANSLLPILILPLTIPLIIFANSAFEAELFTTSFKFLIGILVFMTPTLIFATAAAVKINLE